MASVGQRAAAVTLAVVFLITTLATSGAVIWQMQQEKKLSEKASSLQEQNNQDNANSENKLEGTLLTDFSPVSKVNSLERIDIQVGTGEEVKPGDTVTAHYTGAVAATGVIFQSSHDGGQPIPFGLDQVIKGWTDGVPGMKVGGKRRLLIPADQAYGANPPQGSNIPANADLVFDIEIVKIGE